MDACEVIKEAINIFNTKGWVQGEYGGPRGYCAMGALYKASGYMDYGTPNYMDSYDPNKVVLVNEAVQKVAVALSRNGNVHDIMKFNDSDETAKEDVIAVFERACV